MKVLIGESQCPSISWEIPCRERKRKCLKVEIGKRWVYKAHIITDFTRKQLTEENTLHKGIAKNIFNMNKVNCINKTYFDSFYIFNHIIY